MKKIFLSFVVLLTGLAACDQKNSTESNTVVQESEEVKTQEVEQEKFLGESFDLKNEIQLASLVSEMDTQDSVMAVVEANVTEVCQAKGCWMKVDLPNGESMRVTFKDYGFFMPKDLAGKAVKMNGVAKLEETDVETLKHFAEDGGKSEEEIAQITEPKMDYKFIASGVVLVD